MRPLDLVTVFTARLEGLGIDYFVTGSVASLIYGEPRLTHDVDLVLSLRDSDLSAFETSFPDEDFYRPPREVLKIELRRRGHGHFNLIHHDTGFKADVYVLTPQPLHRWAMSHRRRVERDGGHFWLAPPEYVIVRKLEYFREGGSEKHLRDIRAMIATLGDGLDRELLLRWIDDLGLERPWSAVNDEG